MSNGTAGINTIFPIPTSFYIPLFPCFPHYKINTRTNLPRILILFRSEPVDIELPEKRVIILPLMSQIMNSSAGFADVKVMLFLRALSDTDDETWESESSII